MSSVRVIHTFGHDYQRVSLPLTLRDLHRILRWQKSGAMWVVDGEYLLQVSCGWCQCVGLGDSSLQKGFAPLEMAWRRFGWDAIWVDENGGVRDFSDLKVVVSEEDSDREDSSEALEEAPGAPGENTQPEASGEASGQSLEASEEAEEEPSSSLDNGDGAPANTSTEGLGTSGNTGETTAPAHPEEGSPVTGMDPTALEPSQGAVDETEPAEHMPDGCEELMLGEGSDAVIPDAIDPLKDAPDLEMQADTLQGQEAGDLSDSQLLDGENESEEAGGQRYSKKPRRQYGGEFAVYGRKKDPPSPRTVAEIRRGMDRIFKKAMGQHGEATPRLNQKRLVRELVSHRMRLSACRREEQERQMSLILLDVSGSCSADAQVWVDAAQSLVDADPQCVAILHSNGFPVAFHQHKSKPWNIAEIPTGYNSDDWWRTLIQQAHVSGVVAFGDWDAAHVYGGLVEQGAYLVWLDPHAKNKLKEAKLNPSPDLKRYTRSFGRARPGGKIWYWVGIATTRVGYALRNS